MTESARFIQMLADGLGNGSIYALLAVGFVVIYKSTQVISFAQPALMVAGAVAVSYLGVALGLGGVEPPALGIPIAFTLAVLGGMAFASFLALGVERAALRPLVGRPVFIAAIVTLGVDVVVRNIANRFIGANPKQMNDPFGFDSFVVGGASVPQRDIAVFLIALAVFGALFAFFKFSRLGLAMRAAAFDQEVALAQGINVGTVFAVSWVLAAALAALAGAFLFGESGVDQLGWVKAFKALPAIILGGLDSIGGALIGGLSVGMIEAVFSTYQGDGAGQFLAFLGSNFAGVSPYVLMLLVLMFRPYGLFGTPEIERV